MGGAEDSVSLFLFFSVARSATNSQAERAKEASETAPAVPGTDMGGNAHEKMPTDKLVDISPMALRMSSPFNSGYWLSAA